MNSSEADTLPLIIKIYPKIEGFTTKLFANLKESLRITGPHGRGLCLDAVPAGDIVFFAGGTGLLPYLDLIHLLFLSAVFEKDPNFM